MRHIGFLFVIVSLGLLCNTAVVVTAQTIDCNTLQAVDCLNQTTSCHVNYSTTPVNCVTGAPIDGCAGITNSTICANEGCFWDPFVGYCFLIMNQVNQIYPCANWTSPSPNLACTFHNCQYTTDDTCVTFGTVNRTQDASITLNYTNLVEWKNAQVLPNTLTFQVQAYVPLQIRLNSPTWFVLGLGHNQVGLQSIYNTSNVCNSLTSNMSESAPTTVYYPAGNSALTEYLVSWVRTNHNFNWNVSAPEGVALQKLFGNISVHRVDVTDDSSKLIFTIQRDLNVDVDRCSAYGASYSQTADKTITYYNEAFSFVARTVTDTWSSSTAPFQIAMQLNGAVVISTSITYKTVIIAKEVVSIADSCPSNQQLLMTTYDLIYQNVYDPNLKVGPRTATDLIMSTKSCYHDMVSSFGFVGCANNQCKTVFTLKSGCNNLPIDGSGFLSCTNVPDSVRIADMGSDIGYSSDWLNAHIFQIDAWACAIDNTAPCHQIHPSPDILDAVSATTSLRVYPKAFTNVPSLTVNFAMLHADTDTIDNSAFSGTSFSGTFNSSNNPYKNQSYSQLPNVQANDHVNVAIQLGDSTLRNAYILSLYLTNLTITPTDAFGNVLSNIKAATWTQIRAYLINAPQMFRTTSCPSCSVIPTCIGVSGCDGFTIWSGILPQLFPTAGGYMFYLPYLIQPTRPTAVGRRLLAAVSSDGKIANSEAALFVSAKWVTDQLGPPTPPDCHSFSCWSRFEKAAVIIIPILGLLLFVVSVIKARWIVEHVRLLRRKIDNLTKKNRSKTEMTKS